MITHNKVMMIDDATIFVGSSNFTAMAQKFNAENKLVLNNRDLAGKYRANWERRRGASVIYNAAEIPPGPSEQPL